MQAEKRLLCGWKEICGFIGISRLLLIRRRYPIYDCDKATHRGHGVCAYADELLEAHVKWIRHEID